MIIWGSTTKDKQTGTGTFYCPSCRTTTGYLRQKVSRYFTLYFIPLFATETLAEYVRCGRCSGEYNLSVASLTPAQVEALLRPWRCRCGNHNPAGEDACLACGAAKVAAA